MRFVELVDISKLRVLCKSFTVQTKATTAIFDLEESILVTTGWQYFCICFHQVNHEKACQCLKSDTILACQLKKCEIYNLMKVTLWGIYSTGLTSRVLT